MEPANNDNPARQQQPPPPPPPPPAGLQTPPSHPKCPRCNSTNTKFCYYNNYSLTQPRHFCKACRRYWTHGGTLRNIPIGGGIRRNNSNLPSRVQNSALLRAPPPLMNTSFFSGSGGGVFLPASYAPMQAPSSAARLNLGGGGGQFGANLSLLQAMSLHSLKSPAADQFPPPGNLFPAHQNLMNPSMRPWAKNLNANTDGASSSSASGSTSLNITGVEDQAGPSFSALDDWLTDDDWWTDDDDDDDDDNDDDDNSPGV